MNGEIFKKIAEELGKSTSNRISRSSASELALYISSLFYCREKSVLVVLDDEKEVEKVFSDVFVITGVIPEIFSKWDKSIPGEFSPSPDIVGRRLNFISGIGTGKRSIYLTDTKSFKEKVPSPERIQAFSTVLNAGQKIQTEKFSRFLISSGYTLETNTINPGEYSIRGGIIDVFSPAESFPARIELFGEDVEDIRIYEPSKGKSIKSVEEYRVFPAREIMLFEDEIEKLKAEYPEYPDAFIFGGETIASSLRKHDVPLKDLKFDGLVLTESESENSSASIDWGTGFASFLDLGIDKIESKSIESEYEDFRMFFFVRSQSLSKALKKYYPEADFIGKPLSSGFALNIAKALFITEKELFGHEPRLIGKNEREKFFLKEEIEFLPLGSYVVHEESGIAKYRGIKTIENAGQNTEYLILEYADEAFLYLPVHKLHLVTRYIGPKDSSEPKLSNLGSSRWLEKKRRAKKQIWDMTIELAQHYAVRKASKAPSVEIDDELRQSLSQTFEFEETPDQLKAINDVYTDLSSSKPMDRLICGEVGFGKTEVAIRAAMKSANSGFQTAVLVPTTVLCQQHLEVFRRRLEDYPLKIEMLSRFVSREGAKKVLENVALGKTDIVVGTHRLLSKDVVFKNLGLLVVDEEHKFGVKQKEKLRKIKKNVNTLMMSATPIPRTLHMSLWNLMDVSQINTPPPGRMPIETSIIPFSEKVIKDAVYFEVERGGQVFFLHNRIDSLQAVEVYLKKIFPDVTMKSCHGRMSSAQIEKIMIEFYDHEFDMLISTTIIESGLDIKNANTLIVDRADTLGLAQLHQIRGRIGRSDVRAYCYFMIPRKGPKTDSGRERLKAIRSYARLGAGYQLALHDMKIRGVGNLLGKEQSGYDFDIGYELYMKYLEEAVEKVRAEKGHEKEITHEIWADFPYYIPPEYVKDVNERVYLYRKIAAADLSGLDEIKSEVRDKFGPLPDSAKIFFEISTLYRLLKNTLITSLALAESVKIQFAKDPERWYIEKLVFNLPKDWRPHFRRDDERELLVEIKGWNRNLKSLRRLLEALNMDGENL
ncbi:transcription-repair coupling factor [candidate division WOR-3 bacterium]|nr:transcription-repair coupling factor [candidate division WOR-3 bacterium]